MSNDTRDGFRRDDQTHRLLVSQTGLHKFNVEQLATMEKIMGNLTLELDEQVDGADPAATLDLPILSRRSR